MDQADCWLGREAAGWKGRRKAFTFALACAGAVILTKAVGGVLFLIPGKASCGVGALGRKDEVTAASDTCCVRETVHEKGADDCDGSARGQLHAVHIESASSFFALVS